MVPGRRRWRLVRQVGNGVVAACAAAAVLLACAVGYAGRPAIGPVLDPGSGAWASAAGGLLPKSGVLALAGLAGPAAVSFDDHGIAMIDAARRSDAMAALGYLHARFRLTQMDLERRLAEGRLSQLVGPAGVRSDAFELRLGLLRTARREWAAMPRTGLAATILTAYARGVNDYLAQLRADGQWPAVFSLTGVYPARWTPVDSLAVQGGLTQQLDYTTVPLDYALLSRSLGMPRTLRWLPVVSGAGRRGYDPGPYRALGVAPIAGTSTAVAQVSSPAGAAGEASASVARAAAATLAVTGALPPGLVGDAQTVGNAWAVNGPKVAGGGSMLAGVAPVPGPFPSAWYQVAVSAPRYDVSGVTLPGLPGVVAGHNQHIAWSLSSAHDQSALYYVERTGPARPGRYFWRGRWRPMRRMRYAIAVRGGRTRHLTVDLTVHGPVLTRTGQTVAVDWTGSLGSPDVAVLARLAAASSFAQFRAALADWHSPCQTFVYADDLGNIGAVAAGYYPVLRHGAPWLPLPGTGADDMAGVIPYAALPRSFDPPGHVIEAAGQRPVTAAYPYYIGTSASDRDTGGGAGRLYAILARRSGMRPPGLAALQTSRADAMAARLVPRLLAALRQARLTPAEREAAAVLRRWNDSMDGPSAAAAIWAAFWPGYLSAAFGPWWRAAGARIRLGPSGLAAWVARLGLARALEHWTLADPSNPAFTPPGGPAGTAVSVMRAAFSAAVARLRVRLGGPPASWTLDRLPAGSASAPASAQVPVLGRYGGTLPWAGDQQGSAGAAALGLGPAEGTAGQGWRMIISMRAGPAARTRHGSIWAEGIYPGGQSENPASPWYDSLTGRWSNGGYLPMPAAGAAARGPIRWTLRP